MCTGWVCGLPEPFLVRVRTRVGGLHEPGVPRAVDADVCGDAVAQLVRQRIEGVVLVGSADNNVQFQVFLLCNCLLYTSDAADDTASV